MTPQAQKFMNVCLKEELFDFKDNRHLNVYNNCIDILNKPDETPNARIDGAKLVNTFKQHTNRLTHLKC